MTTAVGSYAEDLVIHTGPGPTDSATYHLSLVRQ